MIATRHFSIDELRELGLHVTSLVIRQIQKDISDEPEVFLSEVLVGHERKKALRVDVAAEDTFSRELRRYRDGKFKQIAVFGEERLRDPLLDLSGEPGVCALVDALDGSDLAERSLDNWCSAAVFFAPQENHGQRILASFVGLPNGDLYFATRNRGNVLVKTGRSDYRRVRGTSGMETANHATLCFYGQKVKNLFSVTNLLASLDEKASDNLRVYNLGGIPMMIRLMDHKTTEARGIDALIEVLGQKPHDFVPGAYLLLKAGVPIMNFSGQLLNPCDLENSLLQPSNPDNTFTYVAAATKKLCSALLKRIKCNDRA